jgi:TolB-like protein/DNA-binding winged helix-turn-helix (wHTH) protein/Tfp pilus assembly protein PilF
LASGHKIVTENVAATGWITFDRIEIDLGGRRLLVDGVEAPLEPKAFDVLRLFASHPGRAFTRDEMLDAVWGHRHVTPGVLNRVVTLIRQALGETPQDPRYLQTLHGIGYRFDAPVRRFEMRPTATSDERFITAPINGVAATQPDRGKAGLSAPTAIGAPAPPIDPPSVSIGTMKHDAEPRLGGRPFHSRWLSLVALAVVVAGFAVWWSSQRHPSVPSPSANAAPMLVVLPLRAIGEDKNESVFADGLSEELTTQLAHVDGLRMISSTSAARAQRDGFDAAQLSERLHVTHALEGSLREAGGKLRIDLRLVETPSGRTVWSQGYDRTTNDIFDVQQEIAQAVASALSLNMKLVRSASPAPDPDVFREYLELRHTFMSHSAGPDYDKAEVALNALAARAPDFAPVHGLLALNLASRFEPGREQEALPEATKAIKLDPDSIYAYAALGELACFRYEWNDCMKELRTALALSPADPVMNLLVGMRLARLGYGEEALRHFKIAHATDPLSYWTNANLGTELDVLGRPEDARPYLDTLQSLDPAAHLTGSLRWYNAVLRNDLSDAHDIAMHMPDGDPLKASFLAVGEALANPAAWPDAMRKLQAAQEKRGESYWLQLLIPRPDVAMALHMYGDNNHFGGKFIWSRQFVAIRPDPAFSDFLRRTKTIDYWNANGWPPQCKPAGESAHCD